MRPALAIAVVLIAVGLCSCSRPKAAPPPAPDAIDFNIEGEMTERQIPGLSLVIIKDGNVLKQKGYGVIDLETKKPVTADTPFPLASVTKIFTAAAVLRLVEDFKLSLDDRLKVLLPDLPESWGEVTVRQLLSHTSGLPDIPSDPKTGEDPASREDALKRAAALPLVARPGTQAQYIQTGYVLLGMIVEKETGKSFPVFMRERLFKPLGMDSTRYVEGRATAPGLATSYSLFEFKADGKYDRVGHPIRWDYPIPKYLFPCTGLTTTAADLAKWDLALSEDRVLRPATLDAMWTIVPGGQFGPARDAGWGCGWVVFTHNGKKIARSDGGGHTVYSRFLDDKLTLVVQTNLMGAEPDRLGWNAALRAIPELKTSAR